MADEIDNPSDPNLDELAEALRAGPSSPAWDRAVQLLRAQGIGDPDEKQMLLTVRQHLEAGRDYRSVRAGPGFTRKLEAALDAEPSGSRWSWPLLLAMLGTASLLLAGGLIVWQMLQATAADASQVLAGQLFGTTTISVDPASAQAPGWERRGTLAGGANGGQPGPNGDPATSITYDRLGSIRTADAVSIDTPVAIEASWVSRTADAGPVWIVAEGVGGGASFSLRVSPDGQVAILRADGTSPTLTATPSRLAGGEPVVAQLRLHRTEAAVRIGATLVYAGKSGLDPASGVRLGVRIESPANAGSGPDDGDLIVRSVRVLRP